MFTQHVGTIDVPLRDTCPTPRDAAYADLFDDLRAESFEIARIARRDHALIHDHFGSRSWHGDSFCAGRLQIPDA
jgi:hypothetical protein